MPALAISKRDCVAEQLVLALARREHHGLAAPRLTEPDLATWRAFRGNLHRGHLLSLIAEDAASRFPLPADLEAVLGSEATLHDVPDPTIFGWLRDLTPERLSASTSDALTAMARALNLPFRFAGANLHKIQADTRVLELPGTGGQLVARSLERSDNAVLHINCTVLTSDWKDRALAGFVAMELDAPHQDFIKDDPQLEWASSPANRTRFDLVFGLDPAKGGAFGADQLRPKFPNATIVLV